MNSQAPARTINSDDLDDDLSPDPAPSGRGGRRPGAGRPKGSKDSVLRATPKRKATFKEHYETEVERNQRKIVKAAIRAALRGDSRMLQDMVNRFVGPAKTAVEISGPNGSPIALQTLAATALVGLSDDQLHALAALHQSLGLAPSGDSALSPLLPLSLPALPPPVTIPADPDLNAFLDRNPDPTQPPDHDRQTGEVTGSGGSASSQPTPAPAGGLAALGSGAEGGESGCDAHTSHSQLTYPGMGAERSGQCSQ